MNRTPSPKRLFGIQISGTVQGIGFRPFVFHLAQSLGIGGSIRNTAAGVEIEAETDPDTFDHFLERIEGEKPSAARIEKLAISVSDPEGYDRFEIQTSAHGGSTGENSPAPPDTATCESCLSELFDPRNRRYLYAFITCTQCGPRFSVCETSPFDRASTSMEKFVMCEDCEAEYENPSDRRFHSQTNSCRACGPVLEFWSKEGSVSGPGPRNRDALHFAAQAIRDGKVLAVKGIGGFHLLADARNRKTVSILRNRKRRGNKPFALMLDSIASVREHCEVSPTEQELLLSPQAPIVLLKSKRGTSVLASDIAPGLSFLGVMLPSSPLHHLLLRELGFPLVATSGNTADEPLCADESKALKSLGTIADHFLVHNRPIRNAIDDSIVRILNDEPSILRRARGYTPGIIRHPRFSTLPSRTILAVGGHLKNTFAILQGPKVSLSQHIGNLNSQSAYFEFQDRVEQALEREAIQPQLIACDAHPDYLSSGFAESRSKKQSIPLMRVQHHHAHILSCMTENGISPPLLGVAWDGTGYGTDSGSWTHWGGEFFILGESGQFSRLASLRPIPLPGGEAAIREPRRAALGMLHAIGRDWPGLARHFSPPELTLFRSLLERGTHCPHSSSIGRLFDAVAALIGLHSGPQYEGEAAMKLESLAGNAPETPETDSDRRAYALKISSTGAAPTTPRYQLDWEPLLLAILEDLGQDEPIAVIAARFHRAMAQSILEIAKLASQPRVILSGGVFQNKLLLESTVKLLKNSGYEAFWHRQVPSNDGGLALGQIMAATYYNNF